MQTLHKIGKLSLVILDEKNYAVGEVKPAAGEGGKAAVHNAKYFHTLGPAVKKMASMVSNERARDLEAWLKVYAFVSDSIVDELNEVKS